MQDMLGHQLPVLPPVADFWAALPEIFAWINSQAEAPQRVPREPGSNGVALRTRILPMGIPVRVLINPEIIRFVREQITCNVSTSPTTGGVRRIDQPLSADRRRTGITCCTVRERFG